MPPARWRRSSSASALAVYVCLAIFYLGVPIALHPLRDVVGSPGTPPDTDIFVWSMGWWPHAILHWENPIVTHAIWWPEGYNLAWAATTPGLALLVSPVTLALGPVFAYNLLAVLMPALCAWTAFLLCRRLTRSFWASLAGGYLFGFSAYEFGQTEGHLQLTSVFLVPLVVLVIVGYVDGSRSGRRSALLLGALLGLQLTFSTETSLMLATAIVIGCFVAYAVVPDLRPRLRTLPLVVAGAYAIACAIASPLLAYAILHIQHGSINSPAAFNADLLNLAVPTRLTWIGWSWTRHVAASFQGNQAEQGAYLGLPTLAILAWFSWERRRAAGGRFLLVMLVLGLLAELGTAVHVDGVNVAPMPWDLLAKLPFYDNVLPTRFSGFVALGAAVAVALWAASSRAPRALRVALPLVAIAAVLPNLWLDVWHHHPQRVAFFTDGIYKVCLQPNDVVLTLPSPYWNDAMLWQAETGYSFRMAEGYVSPDSPPNTPDRGDADAVLYNQPGTDWPEIASFAKLAGVTVVVIPDGSPPIWSTLLAPTAHPTEIGGVSLYSLRTNGRSACTAGA